MADNVKEKDALREFTKQARQEILEREKEKYERRRLEENARKERGDDKWMLDSVSARLENSGKKLKSKKKDKSKHKEVQAETEWVEKPVPSTSTEETLKPIRDSWMTEPPSFFPSISRKEMKDSKKRIEDSPKLLSAIDKPGQTKRELNPYWKDGGTGVPDENPQLKTAKSSTPASTGTAVGDAGYGWLMKAYQRAKEEADRDNRPLNDVIVERWGSMDKFNDMLREARAKSGGHTRERFLYQRHHRDRNRDDRMDSMDKERGRSVRKEEDAGTSRRKTWRKPASDEDEKPEPSGSRSFAKSKPNWRRSDLVAKVSEEIPPTVAARPPSPSSESEPEIEVRTAAPVVEILSDKEMNAIGAKILKAELMGNQKLVTELREKLEAARIAQKNQPSTPSGSKEIVILTRTDQKGFTRPLSQQKYDNDKWGGGRKKKDKIKTHDESGKRARYFADDDRLSLKEMFEREKTGTAEDHDAVFARLAARGMETTNYEYDMDDVMTDRASRKFSEAELELLEKQKAIEEHKRTSKILDSCLYCLENESFPKHLIAAIGMNVYLGLPAHKSLTDGHCLIIPTQHAIASTFLDEDVWAEVQIFRKGLTKMFEEMGQDVVFFEANTNLKYRKHLVVNCVPIEKEVGDMAPIYFKKAILESETEWAQNKKLIDLSKKDVRKSVPKGLPYFSVDFGLQGGFAHVVEDHRLFPQNFAQEIIGGMLDLEPQLWRKPPKESFEEQRKKVLRFADWWKPYDWTQRLKTE